jgi:hypothetical protein
MSKYLKSQLYIVMNTGGLINKRLNLILYFVLLSTYPNCRLLVIKGVSPPQIAAMQIIIIK